MAKSDSDHDADEDFPTKKSGSAMARLREKKKAVSRTVPIICDYEVADRYQAASQKLQEAQRALLKDPESQEALDAVEDAEEALEALEDEAKEASEDFTFRGIGRQGFEALIDSHEPTADQRKKARKDGDEVQWNPDTFPQALVAASLVDPDLTEEEVQEIWDSPDWNQAELLELFAAALEVNTTRRTASLGKGSGLTRP